MSEAEDRRASIALALGEHQAGRPAVLGPFDRVGYRRLIPGPQVGKNRGHLHEVPVRAEDVVIGGEGPGEAS